MLRKLLFILLLLSLLVIAVPSVSAQCGGTAYVVVTGDTLFSISQRFGVSMDAIAAANGIFDFNRVNIAQTLCIPSGGTVTTPATGNFGTGGPTTVTSTNNVTSSGSTAAGTVMVNGNWAVPVAPSTTAVVGAGIMDISGYPTTATIELDAINNVLRVRSAGMIPNSYVAIYISSLLGDLSGGRIGYAQADAQGNIDGYVYIPFLSSASHQYVMIRAWDGRMTWGFFDMPRRFP